MSAYTLRRWLLHEEKSIGYNRSFRSNIYRIAFGQREYKLGVEEALLTIIDKMETNITRRIYWTIYPNTRRKENKKGKKEGEREEEDNDDCQRLNLPSVFNLDSPISTQLNSFGKSSTEQAAVRVLEEQILWNSNIGIINAQNHLKDYKGRTNRR